MLDCNSLQRVLKQYVAKLHGRLPKTQSGAVTIQPQAGTSDWQVTSPAEEY